MKDYINILKDIAKQYLSIPLNYDASTCGYVTSVCDQYINKGTISQRQLDALIKIAKRIRLTGPISTPITEPEPLQKGFLGIHCKTGEAYWHSWQIFESK